MESSKKSKVDRVIDASFDSNFTIESTLTRPISALLRSTGEIRRFAVAFSGGPDSSALAICASVLAKENNFELKFFHIHHGLLPQADEWTAHAHDLAKRLNVELAERRVKVDLQEGMGVEAAARKARHHALQQMARDHSMQAVLFAHHLQDQAETVLQRLFRGSGISGMGAMRSAVLRDGCWWLRPWLGVSRQNILACIESFEKATGWSPVQDPTNLDTNYGRGVIRSQLAKTIERHWPGWVRNVARHAEQAQEAQDLLTEYGRDLVQRVRTDNEEHVLELRGWRLLSSAQQVLVLRTWLSDASVQMPTEKRLSELCRQLNQVHALGHDRALHWRHVGCDVKCSRGKIYLQVTI